MEIIKYRKYNKWIVFRWLKKKGFEVEAPLFKNQLVLISDCGGVVTIEPPINIEYGEEKKTLRFYDKA